MNRRTRLLLLPHRVNILSLMQLWVWILAAMGWLWSCQASDSRWDYRFGMPGTDGAVLAATWHQNNLYLGGGFRAAGQARAISVARWDGTNYWPLGDGLQGDVPSEVSVYALAGFAGDLYAGGVFTHSGTSLLPGLARWNGTSWNSVGGATGAVYSLTVAGGGLWVAGAFNLPDDTNFFGLAKWDGASWASEGRVILSRTNSDDVIGAVAVLGTDMFIAGTFSTLNSLSISNQARWNGANWLQISCVSTQAVNGLAVHQGEVYACGALTALDGVAATNIARWDGTQWSPVGTGLSGPCHQLLSSGASLYALGEFTNAGAVFLEGLARWDGAAWQAVGEGLWPAHSGAVPCVLTSGDAGQLFLGGVFQNIQGRPAANVAAWDGNQWGAVAPASAFGAGGTIGLVRAFATSPEAVYAGGVIEQVGRAPVSGVARSTGQGWSDLGAGLPGFLQIRALAVQGTNLFAGGSFTNAGGGPARNLARWDGQGWWPVGGGLDSNVLALATTSTNVYAGGEFLHAGEAVANHVGSWDGVAWSALGGGVNGAVKALSVHQGRLYVGGAFTEADGAPASCVAVWDGAAWQALGAGVASAAGEASPQVRAIAVAGTNVYVGGCFTLAGGQPANNVARWDGASWSPLGSGVGNGVQGVVDALAVRGDQLFVGGFFTNAGGLPALSLARWDGTNWSTLGAGLEWASAHTPRVYALTLRQNELWVGGLFSHAGLKPAANVARWVEAPGMRLSPPSRAEGNAWRLPVTGVGGLRFRLEGTTNLVDWTKVATGQGEGDDFEFLEAAPPPVRLYRAVLEP